MRGMKNWPWPIICIAAGGLILVLVLISWLMQPRISPEVAKLQATIAEIRDLSHAEPQQKEKQKNNKWFEERREQFEQRQEARLRLYCRRSMTKRIFSHEYQINWLAVDRDILYRDSKALASAIRELCRKQKIPVPKELSDILARD